MMSDKVQFWSPFECQGQDYQVGTASLPSGLGLAVYQNGRMITEPVPVGESMITSGYPAVLEAMVKMVEGQFRHNELPRIHPDLSSGS
jgi:hypothetical protein